MTAPEPRVALVTGAARGIGAAVARRLAAEGWRQVLVDGCRDDPALHYPLATPEELEATVDACGADVTVGVRADVRDQQALERAVSQAVERFGGLDAVVAAAGAIVGGLGWEIADDAWHAMIGVNLEGVWRTIRAAVPTMLRRPEPRCGRIVAVASAGGVRGLPRLAAYAAAKHGVIGLVRSLAAELAPAGITVNAVAPGSTDTAMLRASADIYGLSHPSEFGRHHLAPRLLDPDEVAAMVAWVCSVQATGVTGSVLPVDLGMTAR